MAITIVKSQPNVQGVGANQTFTLGCPVGVKAYEAIGLEMGGTTFNKDDITNLDLKIGGKPAQQFKTVAHLEAISAYYGYSVNANEIVFPYRREHLQDMTQGERFSMGVADVSTFQISGKIDNTAVAPTLDAYSLETQFRTPEQNRLGLFTKIPNFQFSLVGAGTTEIDNIPREAWMQALHIMQTSGNVTAVEVWIDGINVWDASDARMENIVERAGRTRQSNVYHCDWLLKNELGTQLALVDVQDFRLKVTHSAADTIVVYPEYLSNLGGI